MAKTKPIGVRFDQELKLELELKGLKTPQQILSFLEANYRAETKSNRELGQKLRDAVKATDPSQKLTDSDIPTNLAQLKELCPHKEGFERSAWISTERIKYGI